MKACSYCGKEYADGVDICPLDGNPVVRSGRKRNETAPVPRLGQSSFDLNIVSFLSSTGTYRVFVERNDIIFIQVEGGIKPAVEALAPIFGPWGGLIPLAWRLFTRNAAKEKLQHIAERNPADLLGESGKNFKLNLAEIRDAAVEAPTFFSTGGKGKLILLVRHDEKITGEFKTAEEMGEAIRLLSPLLNATLRVNVEWNRKKQRFEEKKKDLTR